MEFQRRPSAVSQMSYSDTELDIISGGGEQLQFLADLHDHSHFFAPLRNQRYSTPLILISPDNSVHNSTSSIPSSLTTMTEDGGSSPSISSARSGQQRPKKFSLNLNGHLSTSHSHLTTTSPDKLVQPSEGGGVHRGDQYSNKERLAQDLSALASMPELCDVTFLVGGDRQPVCGVRAILAARSK